MSEWLKILVTLTIAGSTVIVGMLLIRLFRPHAFSAQWQYLTGKAALAFYLLPVIFVTQRLPVSSTKTMSNSQSIITEPGIEIIPKVSYLSSEIGLTIFSIWAMGAVIFAGWHLYCFCKFSQRIRSSSLPLPQNSDITKLVTAYQRKLGISGSVRVAYNCEIGSPVLVGLFKPTILLPRDFTPGVDLGMVIHHELIHLKRNDLWVKMLVLVASAIHWFNPFIHMLRKDIHIWSELSCDEEVVKEMPHAERKRYGETILNLLEKATEMPTAFCASLSENGMQLKQRLIRLLSVKKRSKYTFIIAVVTVIAIGGLGTTTAAWAAKYIPAIHLHTLKDQVSAPTQPALVQEEYVKWATDFTFDINVLEENVERLKPVEVRMEETEPLKILKKIDLDEQFDLLDVKVITVPTSEIKVEEVTKASPTQIKLQE